jgi:hypothetical protein
MILNCFRVTHADTGQRHITAFKNMPAHQLAGMCTLAKKRFPHDMVAPIDPREIPSEIIKKLRDELNRPGVNVATMPLNN